MTNPFAKKLTEEAVIDILNDKTSSAKEIAARHGVNQSQVFDIHRGKTWKYITLDPKYTRRNFKQESRKLTVEIATAIKNNEIKDYKALAKQLGCSAKYLKSLRNPNRYECWKTIPIVGETVREYNIHPIKPSLTDEQVVEIITDGKSTIKELSDRYNVDKKVLYELFRGKSYKRITKHYTMLQPVYVNRKLTIDIVKKIRNGDITDYEAVMKKYSVCMKHIKKILNPNSVECWKYVK